MYFIGCLLSFPKIDKKIPKVRLYFRDFLCLNRFVPKIDIFRGRWCLREHIILYHGVKYRSLQRSTSYKKLQFCNELQATMIGERGILSTLMALFIGHRSYPHLFLKKNRQLKFLIITNTTHHFFDF